MLFRKLKISFALLLGAAFFSASDAHAMKTSELEKLPLPDQAGYVVQVINAHLSLVGHKNVELAKKTELEMYKASKANGVYQGVVNILAIAEQLKEKDYDVELICRLVLDQTWKNKGWKHGEEVAKSAMFVPKGYQVAYNPPKKDGGTTDRKLDFQGDRIR
jgi:hypothetical protein